ncbi:MAG: glycosyl hydrolase [Candidatus Omnitrophica bacterium]|nr:glycosyl hydrolase [Candidatus Omnitrophota bacterium]
MKIHYGIDPACLSTKIERLFELSYKKILSLEKIWDPAWGTPVFTVQGRYTTRGWTEWTQGFQYGMALLQFDATGERPFLELGRARTVERMAPHVSHTGVHDHGFNNISTYGHLRRLMREGRMEANEWELRFYELALKISGAVQAARWSSTADGLGYIYSFNGPHSLFVDTIRSLRSLGLAHRLGHVLMSEGDQPVSLLERLIQHGRTTARYNIYYGRGRDAYDTRGRTVHEAIFNRNDGRFRCPSTQQGYSPFSTWTRGLAWAITGFAEQLEFLDTVSEAEFESLGGRSTIVAEFQEAAQATADFYIHNTPVDGIPYWDTGAPGLARLGDYLNRPADPFNGHEPVDSSAAGIAAQGLLRLGKYLSAKGKPDEGHGYYQAGLTIAATLFDEPYLSTRDEHQGLILHSVYHRPNGWDSIPEGSRIPQGESSMWGDYHALELALLLRREIQGGPYPTFFS